MKLDSEIFEIHPAIQLPWTGTRQYVLKRKETMHGYGALTIAEGCQSQSHICVTHELRRALRVHSKSMAAVGTSGASGRKATEDSRTATVHSHIAVSRPFLRKLVRIVVQLFPRLARSQEVAVAAGLEQGTRPKGFVECRRDCSDLRLEAAAVE